MAWRRLKALITDIKLNTNGNSQVTVISASKMSVSKTLSLNIFKNTICKSKYNSKLPNTCISFHVVNSGITTTVYHSKIMAL